MLEGIIIENSLNNPDVLKTLEVVKTWEDGSWKLHSVRISAKQASSLSHQLADGPWYIHFWKENQNDVLVIFKNKEFWIKFDDKNTWKDALQYGLSLGIPKEQLDFLIDQ